MEAPVSKKGVVLTAGRYRLLQPIVISRGILQDTDISDNEGSLVSATKPLKPASPKQGDENNLFNLPTIPNIRVKQEIEVVKQYLKDTFIEQHMKRFTAALLQNEILPYNPYPGFIRRFRKLAERFHMEKKSLQTIRSKLDSPVSSDNGVLYTSQYPNSDIWGLEHIVGHINPKTIEGYRGMVESSTISSEVATNVLKSEVTVLTSLSGPCIFCKSFYSEWSHLEIKVAIVVSSNDISIAAKTFTSVLIQDLKQMLDHKDHILTDVTIPVEDEDGWTTVSVPRRELASLLKNSSPDEDIVRSIVHGVMSKKRILSTCLLWDVGASKVVSCTKQYNMLLLQGSSTGQTGLNRPVKSPSGTPRLVISTLPFQALHEGVFIKKQHAEEYLSLFQRYYTTGVPQPNANQARNRRTKPALNGDPMRAEMLQPILQAWQMKVASEPLESSAFSSVHYMLLMHLAETRVKTFANHTEQDLAIQICRFYSSTAALLKSVSSYSPLIEELLSSSESNLSKVTDDVVSFYRRRLLEIVDADLLSRSTQMESLKLQIDSIFQTGGRDSYHATLPSHLRQLSHYITTVILSYIEDALDRCQAIVSLKTQLNQNYPHLTPPVIKIPKQTQFKHGIINPAWTNVDKLKISRKDCVSNLQVPKAVALQYALMQYASDVRLDETWMRFLHQLLLQEQHLPPNPFPLLISHLRRSSISVHTKFEHDNTAVNRLIQNKIAVFDSSNNIFTVNGTSAFGKKSSLLLLNLKGFRQVSEISAHVALSPPGDAVTGVPVSSGQFQVIPCICVVPPSTYHGSLSPYLCTLYLNEHCFVRGPVGQLHKGAAALAKILKSHLTKLKSSGLILHQAKFGGVILNLKNATNFSRFESEFSAASSGGQEINISFYFPLSWRYVLVKKHMFVYYVEEKTDRATLMSSSTNSSGQEFSIFFHPADALHCFRSNKSHMTDFGDSALIDAWKSCDWSQMISLLAIKAIFLHENSDTDNSLRNEILAFCLRYNNSVPGNIDYVIGMGQALEGVINMAVTAMENNVDLVGVIDQALVEKMALEFKIKLGLVFAVESTLSCSCMVDFLLRKLQPVAFRDQKTNAVFVKYDTKSTSTLQEVLCNMIEIRNSIALDLLHATPSVYEYLIKCRQTNI
ncbi:uncharacterized protein LOC100186104 [Ciona intestinalis]